jgi:hypothetical protein
MQESERLRKEEEAQKTLNLLEIYEKHGFDVPSEVSREFGIHIRYLDFRMKHMNTESKAWEAETNNKNNKIKEFELLLSKLVL